MSKNIILCYYNGDLVFPAGNVAIAWGWIAQKCSDNHQEPPHSYPQVTRIINAEGKYIHHANKGKWYEIALRSVIKRDKGQLQIPIEGTVVKQREG